MRDSFIRLINMKKNIIEGIIAVGVLIGMILGGINYFAKANDLKLVELRLDQKIVSDQVTQIQRRMWLLEDRHGGIDCYKWKSRSDRDEYRRLRDHVQKLKKKLDVMMRK